MAATLKLVPGQKKIGLRGARSNELRGIALFIVALWLIFFVDRILPLDRLALTPRTVWGLSGIVAMPFLHANLMHLISNTVPLAILLALVAAGRRRLLTVAVAVVLLGGSLLWLFGRSASHVGASGLVFGLAAYLIAGGYRPESIAQLLLAVLTLFLYGGSLFVGLLPLNEGVSWDGHLCGAIAGVAVALSTRVSLRPSR